MSPALEARHVAWWVPVFGFLRGVRNTYCTKTIKTIKHPKKNQKHVTFAGKCAGKYGNMMMNHGTLGQRKKSTVSKLSPPKHGWFHA